MPAPGGAAGWGPRSATAMCSQQHAGGCSLLPPASSSSAAASAALALAGLHKRGRKSSTTRCAAVQDGKTCNGRANRYGNLLCDRHRKQLVRGRGAMMEAANDVLRAEALANYKPKKRRRRSKKK